AGFDGQIKLLISRTRGAIPFGRAGAGQLRPGVSPDVGADIQTIATGNAARWMNDDVLADLRTFGIQMFLHPQRAFVPPLDRTRAVAETPIAQLQLGMPARGEQRSVGGKIHRVSIAMLWACTIAQCRSDGYQ